jgi:hypothetical protein
MTPNRIPPLGFSAPDLTGPTSIVLWPVAATPSHGRPRPRFFVHAHLEVDLMHEVLREPGLPVFRQLEALIREREVVEVGDLLRLSAETLHALASQGFSRVDHWETRPGGWLPLPEPSHPQLIEPLGHMLRALQHDRWKRLGEARSFAVRLSGAGPNRADLVVRRVHRERLHSISLDLHGKWTTTAVRDLVGALRRRLPVLRSEVTSVTPA